MKLIFKKILSLILVTILLVISISNIVLATDTDNNTTINIKKENNIENTNNIDIEKEELKNENENTSIDNNSMLEKNITESNNSTLDFQESINHFDSGISQNEMQQILEKYTKNISTLSIENTDTGIWIASNSRNLIENFINNHSSYTYSIDQNGFLVCDNILKNNENLDLAVQTETEVDIAIKNILDENKKIIIEVSDNYYTFKDITINVKKFESNMKSKAYEYDNTRVVILNSQYYNINEIEYNLVLSDNFIKILDNIQYKVLTGEIQFSQEQTNVDNITSTYSSFTDNGQALGRAIMDQTVYHGPNNDGTYCTVGSIDQGEKIAILGSEGNYYHILYAITNSSNEKTGYVLKSNILTTGTIGEEVMTGGYRYAKSSQNIYSRGLYSVSVSYGSVANTEGVTLLYDYNINSGEEVYKVGFVEYWTGNGMKRGYIKMEFLKSPFTTKLVQANSKKITYTGPDSTRFKAGTGAIGQNEYVCLLGYTGNYLFIEYNTKTGRKRAFCTTTDLGISNPSSLGITQLPDSQMNKGYLSSTKQDVSAGPGKANSLCSYVGVIGKNESVYRQTNNGITPYNQFGYTYIIYYAGESLKGGFVQENTLSEGKNPSIPEIPSSVGKDGGFKEVYYWQSGLGGPLHSYKIGNGNKRLYLIYAQHGFEDEGYGDGVEVVDIAYKFMDYMYNNKSNSDVQSILTNWTIFVVPYVNRDGITAGSSDSGPGRCTVKDEIDINRNWPTKIYVKCLDKGRNYTGEKTLATVEAQGLRDMLMKDEVKPINGANSILIDIHGWDCETIGNKRIGNYYYEQFQEDSSTHFISHNGGHNFQCRGLESNEKSSGYLAQWAVENGIDSSIILELPSHTNRNTGNRSLSDRFNSATINLLLAE